MKVVMFEKVLSGYGYSDYMTYWQDETGSFHKKHGPAIINDCGQWQWYKHGKFIKSINIEDDSVQIEEIMDQFDFRKVHNVMKFMDWKWYGGENVEVPNVEMLREEARRILNDLKKRRNDDEPYFISCGGFKGTACKSGFTLEFVLEQWET